MVGDDGLRAVVDWELAHVGDPMEDLGWLCPRAWRFGAEPPVAGVGAYDDLVTAYEEASGRTVDREALRWWVVFGSLKWGVICIIQSRAHLDGMTRSVELDRHPHPRERVRPHARARVRGRRGRS